MKKSTLNQLSRRERQIMEIIYRMGQSTAADIHKALPDPPSYSAVRALLAILKDKGMVKHERVGRAYVYRPTIGQRQARDSALRQVVQTFFDGSISGVVAALVNSSDKSMSDEDFKQLEQMVRKKRKVRGAK